MKPTKISKLPDGAIFVLSKRTKIKYRLDRKERGAAWISALESNRTFTKPKTTVCYVAE